MGNDTFLHERLPHTNSETTRMDPHVSRTLLHQEVNHFRSNQALAERPHLPRRIGMVLSVADQVGTLEQYEGAQHPASA